MKEKICIPILEKESGLKVNKDFIVRFSPERINPRDKINRLEIIVKVESDSDGEVFNIAYVGREYLIDIYHLLTKSLGKISSLYMAHIER